MKYTHIHIRPRAKRKQSNKNKVQQIDPVNKGNQNLYLPVKNKSNLNTNWKTKPTNMLRGKERNKEQICKFKQRQIKKIYVHLKSTATGKEQQEKQTKE